MSDRVPVPLPPPTREERNLAMLAQLFGLLGFIVSGVGHIVAPLVLWYIKREESPFVAFHAMQTTLFQLAMTLGTVAVVLVAVVTCVGVVLVPVWLVIWLVFSIMGTVAAARGEWSRYPVVGNWVLANVIQGRGEGVA